MPKGGRLSNPTNSFQTMDNEGEYEPILVGLKATKALGLQEFDLISDSKFVLRHVMGQSMVHEPNTKKYL